MNDTVNSTAAVALVTGAGSGIGRAGALRLADAGWAVGCIDIDAEAAARTAARVLAAGGTASAITADVADREDVRRAVANATAAFGRIDLVWSNAGVSRHGGLETTPQDWTLSWDVNCLAHVWLAAEVIPAFVDRGTGTFLLTASAAGLLTHPASAVYAVTKHAAVAFAEWLAVTYRGTGVRVHCVAPKVVRTPMMKEAIERSPRSAAAAAAFGDVLEPAQVASEVVAALDTDQFLILPHSDVAAEWAAKAADVDAWINATSAAMSELTIGTEGLGRPHAAGDHDNQPDQRAARP